MRRIFLLNSLHTVPLKPKLQPMVVLTKHGNWEKSQDSNCFLLAVHTLEPREGSVVAEGEEMISHSSLSSDYYLALDLVFGTNIWEEKKLWLLSCYNIILAQNTLGKKSSLKRVHTHVGTYILLLDHTFIPQIVDWVT